MESLLPDLRKFQNSGSMCLLIEHCLVSGHAMSYHSILTLWCDNDTWSIFNDLFLELAPLPKRSLLPFLVQDQPWMTLVQTIWVCACNHDNTPHHTQQWHQKKIRNWMSDAHLPRGLLHQPAWTRLGATANAGNTLAPSFPASLPLNVPLSPVSFSIFSWSHLPPLFPFSVLLRCQHPYSWPHCRLACWWRDCHNVNWLWSCAALQELHTLFFVLVCTSSRNKMLPWLFFDRSCPFWF